MISWYSVPGISRSLTPASRRRCSPETSMRSRSFDERRLRCVWRVLFAMIALLVVSCGRTQPKHASDLDGVRTDGNFTPGPVGAIAPRTGLERCGPHGTARIVPLGAVSVHSGERSQHTDYTITPENVVFTAGVQGCWCPNTAVAYQTGCDVRVAGTDIYVTSRFCLGSRLYNGPVLNSCKALSAQCTVPKLEPGTYSIHVEDKSPPAPCRCDPAPLGTGRACGVGVGGLFDRGGRSLSGSSRWNVAQH